MIGCKNKKQEMVLILETTDDNPKNSEGDLFQLKDEGSFIFMSIFNLNII